jgi:3-oxoacyl-[acyl-carrier-protein] synthase-1
MTIAIGGMGIVSPVGDDARMTMASILSGVQLFDDLDVRGPGGQLVTGGRVPLESVSFGVERLATLGLLALRECVDQVRPQTRAPLIVCVPEPADMGGDPQFVLAGAAADAALPVDLARSAAIPEGRRSPIAALDTAARLFGAGHPGCFLVAVDSLISAGRVARLRRQGRLGEGAQGDGFIPSEAAIALWLTPREDDRTLAVVAAHAEAPEPRVPDSEAPVSAVGLTAAVRTALQDADRAWTFPRNLVHDASGPQAWSEEIALLCARPTLAGRPPERIVGPAISTGEIGAASAALSIALAAFFISEGELDGAALTLMTGSGPTRAAALVVPPRRSGRDKYGG